MLFVSTSGALGRYIDLPIPVTIALRALLALIFLLLYCKLKGISLRVEKRHILPVVTSGLLMGVHWLSYFYALKLSNVAIGMISLFTYPILTAFLEPWLLKTKLQKVHLVLGLMVLIGIYFLVPNFDLKNNGTLAVVVGIFSALAYALRNIVLKTKVSDYNGSMLMSYQMGVVVVFLFPFIFTADIVEITSQWEAVVALAFLTTAVGHTMFLNSFKHFSITTVSILSSIQPIFGISIGAIFLSEIPSQNTIIGGVLILGSVIFESIRTSRLQS